MKIGVISDTHLKQADRQLEDLINGPFKEVEMIIHAGDITELGVLDSLGKKRILAVCGNMDSPEVRRQFPPLRVWQAGKFKIGVIHGWGSPRGIEERIRKEFEQPDCIVYGHTHAPSMSRREGILFFNPGSFGGSPFAPKRSVGLLEVGDDLAGQIIYLGNE